MKLLNNGGGVILISEVRDEVRLVYLYGDPRCKVDYQEMDGGRYAVVTCLYLPEKNPDKNLSKCRYRAKVSGVFDEVTVVGYVLTNGKRLWRDSGRRRSRRRVKR